MQNIRGKQFPVPKFAVCSIFLFFSLLHVVAFKLKWTMQKESLIETEVSFCNALLRDYVFLAKDTSDALFQLTTNLL